MEQQEFVLPYQSKVNLRSGKIVGAETLIRWQHPELGLLPPSAFLPLIENHALAVELGEWVLDRALHQMVCWQQQGLEMAVSVNVGSRHLSQEDFAQRLRRILASHPDARRHSLELEMLETSSPQDLDTATQLIEACRGLNVSVALAKFGTVSFAGRRGAGNGLFRLSGRLA